MAPKKISILDNDDPLNSIGKGKNPLTNKKYSQNYIDLATNFWSKLPVYKKAKDIVNTFHSNDVMIIKSGTGSGKSVIVPKLVSAYFNYDKKVIMTFPRQAITQAGALKAAETLDVPIGDFIGYKYKDSNPEHYNLETNMLLYATDGTIRGFLSKDINLKDYSTVIIDEAHERNVNMDILFMLLKSAMISRKDTKNPLKLVIMSATIDERPFVNYFEKDGFSVGVCDFPAKPNYPVKEFFLDQPLGNDKFFVQKAYEIINENIFKKKLPGDIIVFINKKEEALEMCKRFAIHPEVVCIEFYRGMTNEQKELAVSATKYKEVYPNKTRKIIAATNMAESSITFDGLKFVVDNGKAISAVYNPITKGDTYRPAFVTRGQIKQRIGRVGRTSPGTAYHIYTEDEYDELFENRVPEILSNDITPYILEFVKMVHNEKNVRIMLNELLSPPKREFVESAFSTLKNLCVLNKSGTIKKPFGYDILDLVKNVTEGNVWNSVLYYYAHKFGVLKEMSAILFFIEFYKGVISKNKGLYLRDDTKYIFDEILGDIGMCYNEFVRLELYENKEYLKLQDNLNLDINVPFESIDEDIGVKKALKDCFMNTYINIPEKVVVNKKGSLFVKDMKVNLSRNNPYMIRPEEMIMKYKKMIFMSLVGNNIDYIIGV